GLRPRASDEDDVAADRGERSAHEAADRARAENANLQSAHADANVAELGRGIRIHMQDLAARIEAHIARAAGEPLKVRSGEAVAGGACQDSLKGELDGAEGVGARWVLRSDARSSIAGSINRAEELSVIRAAVAAGVKTPEARWPAKDLVRD